MFLSDSVFSRRSDPISFSRSLDPVLFYSKSNLDPVKTQTGSASLLVIDAAWKNEPIHYQFFGDEKKSKNNPIAFNRAAACSRLSYREGGILLLLLLYPVDRFD